jgi:hypothetical protein
MAVATGLVVIGLVIVVLTVKDLFTSEGAKISVERMYIDASTGKPFQHDLVAGEMIPTKAPSGGKTGYPAEKCYWTKDGKPKTEPTWVLLKSYTGVNEPTFCPDCGRLVVGHNPAPQPGAKPPPTKEEYSKR